MKKTGAWLVRYALEQIGVRYTFGIPGVHNTEIYDELNNSTLIQPVLVTHEVNAAFMADAISRTSGSIGVLMLVPAAGVAYAAAGIGEASLDGIPMLVISGGVRTDGDKKYQLHQMDQHQMLAPITKKTLLVENHTSIIPAIYDAYRLAMSGEPGPVFVEIPVNLQMHLGVVQSVPEFGGLSDVQAPDNAKIKQAAQLLSQSKHPGLFIGWGAHHCSDEVAQIAQLLNAPVSTTLQGLSSFPGDHKLHTGMGFGPSSVPAAEQAFVNCDCMLAIGTRFSEIATGSYGVKVPEDLIHIDINPDVFNANFPAKIAIEGDSKQVLVALIECLKTLPINHENKNDPAQQIKKNKTRYYDQWRDHQSGSRVNPYLFFNALRKSLKRKTILVADDGNHTFLTAELMTLHKEDRFISPTDFNCMGYCTPAVIASKLANKDYSVVGIVGDGAFLMSCMEIITAVTLKLGCVFYIFKDGELSQISQAQDKPYRRKTCTVLGAVSISGIAQATGADYLLMNNNESIASVISEAQTLVETNKAVIVEVNIDYSKSTRFTQGVISTNLKRFPLTEKLRFVSRALWRGVFS